jgi:hypothetical protein
LQAAWSCCTREHGLALAAERRGCARALADGGGDGGGGGGCCAALSSLRCFACEGTRAVAGGAPPVCGRSARLAWEACSGLFVSAADLPGGWPRPCEADSLLCAPLGEVLTSPAALLAALGVEPAADGAPCWDAAAGLPPPPPAERAALDAAAAAAGLGPAAAAGGRPAAGAGRPPPRPLGPLRDAVRAALAPLLGDAAARAAARNLETVLLGAVVWLAIGGQLWQCWAARAHERARAAGSAAAEDENTRPQTHAFSFAAPPPRPPLSDEDVRALRLLALMQQQPPPKREESRS